MVTACCSAMPTSKNLSGNASLKGSMPVPSLMAAVMTARSFSSLPMRHSVSPAMAELSFLAVPGLLPVSGSNFPMPWNLLGSFSAGP